MENFINFTPPNIPNPMKEFREMHQAEMLVQGQIAQRLEQLIALQAKQNELLAQLLAKT